MINPEYGIMDENHYIPDPGLVDYGLTDVEILPKKDGSQGVSVYDKGSLVAHISGKSNNDILTVSKEGKTVCINLDEEKITPNVYEGDGIIIGKEVGKAYISVDDDYIRKIVKVSGRNGINVIDDGQVKWVEIDDHYIDDGHSWDNPLFSDADY